MDQGSSSGSDAGMANDADPSNHRLPFAARIRAGMEVIDAAGGVIGTVDKVDSDEILLAGNTGDMVPISLVDAVDGTRVTLRPRGDNAFGEPAG